MEFAIVVALRRAWGLGHLEMSALPVVYLARHGGTAWTVSGQHTGVTDLPLTPQGEDEAIRLGERLEELSFAGIFTSPLQRAVRTCELAGFASAAEVDPDLREWNYGSYEGRTSAEIRADWVIRRVRAIEGDVLQFSSGQGYEPDWSEPATLLWNENPHHEHISPTQAQGRREKAQR